MPTQQRSLHGSGRCSSVARFCSPSLLAVYWVIVCLETVGGRALRHTRTRMLPSCLFGNVVSMSVTTRSSEAYEDCRFTEHLSISACRQATLPMDVTKAKVPDKVHERLWRALYCGPNIVLPSSPPRCKGNSLECLCRELGVFVSCKTKRRQQDAHIQPTQVGRSFCSRQPETSVSH